MSTVQIHVELKGAYTRLERARADLKNFEVERGDVLSQLRQADDRIATVRAKIGGIEGEIKKLKRTPDIIVSEHALLRYVERVMGINIEEVKQKILAPEVVNAITHFHSGNIPHPDGFSLRARENVVTTVVNELGDES